MKKKEHLPLFGVGPIYVYSIAILTLLAFRVESVSYTHLTLPRRG